MLANSAATIWGNQKELTKSHDNIEEQFCVLGRLSIANINDIRLRIESDEVVTEDIVELSFKEWQAFRARPDFRNFMVEWFLGVPLDKLPPPPAVDVEPEPDKAEPQEFGGDYEPRETSSSGDETAVEGQSESYENSEATSLPSG